MIKSNPTSPLSRPRKQTTKKHKNKAAPQKYDNDPERLVAELHGRRTKWADHEELDAAHADPESSQRNYAHLYDFAPVGYFTLSRHGVVHEVNITGAGKLGRNKRTLIGKPFISFCADAADHEVFLRHCNEVIEKKKKSVCEVRMRRKNGECFPAQLRSIPAEDGLNKTAQIRTALSDITEQRRAEDDLRTIKENLAWMVCQRTAELETINEKLTSEINDHKKTVRDLARLAAVVESATDAIVITDPRGGTIRYVNKAFTEMTGYSKEEAVGNNLHMLDSGKQDEQFYSGIRDAISRHGTWTGQLINKKKDGTLYFELCTYFPLRASPDGLITDYVSLKRDITESVRLASIAESVAHMENIGFIFSAIRHEIGDPLSTLLITLEVMQRKLAVQPVESIRKYLDNALGQVARLEYVMTSLKSFNMFENLLPADVDLRSFLDKFLSLVREDFERNAILIESHVSAGAEHIRADSRALQQVMLNLFTNAAVALEGRERPRISICACARPEFPDKINIRVEDNGCGMTLEEQKNLFKPFYTTRPNGTGLGMVIVKKMLLKMNGGIEVKSKKNTGTIVDLFIPRGGAFERGR